MLRREDIEVPSIPVLTPFFGDGRQKTCKGDVGINAEASTAFPAATLGEGNIPQLTQGAPEVWVFSGKNLHFAFP